MGWYEPLACKNEKIVVGLMSGTSLDGVDAAVVRINGWGINTKIEILGYILVPYEADLRQQILDCCSPETSRVDLICNLNVRLGEIFADVAKMAASESGVSWEDVDFISSHGQTIYHMPEQEATLQIGELAVIAQRTNKVVVGDFRPHDLAVGGQGAPLIPYVDYLLFRDAHRGRVLLNIGGISNLSVIAANARREEVFAFDIGPGNMIIDAFVRFGTNDAETFDDNGKYARSGKVDEDWLRSLLQHPYYHMQIPKTTGREMFGSQYARILWQEAENRKLSFEDRVATITALTSAAIHHAISTYVQPKVEVKELIVGGGGERNSVIMESLQSRLPNMKVVSSGAFGISSDAKEAVAFAILGNEAIHRIPNQLPSATGARQPVVMGKVVLPT
jgi:anhydro-N-acetylmuramic acid kinase